MKFLSRVVWSEGMYLGPHHFQVQSRYFEDSIRFAAAALWFEAQGFVGLALDQEALRNGTVSVLHARGIFPDGMPFQMPESDPLPPPRQIGDAFSPIAESLTVYLALPQREQDGVNTDLNGHTPDRVRFTAEPRPIHDELTGREERQVQLGRKNIELRLGTENLDGYTALPVARVRRDANGHFIYDPRFIPPCTRLTASNILLDLLAQLVEILEEKATALQRGRQGRSLSEYSTRDLASFWMLHSVNSAVAPLRHLLLSKRGHPEELYRELARLAGALCTFTMDSHPRTLPKYDHAALGEVFFALDDHIRRHLATMLPTSCIVIPLVSQAEAFFYDADIADTRIFGRSRWILGIRSNAGEAKIITETPRLVKLCSAQGARSLVRKAQPGLPLTHLPVPPSAVPVKVDWTYFSVSRAEDNPCWRHMMHTKQVGVYIPGELTEPELELLVVLDTQ